jgi:DNA-binding NarL/FixJ family response regulator
MFLTVETLRTQPRNEPLRIAVVNDYELIVRGLAEMLQPFAARVQVVEAVANAPVQEHVDVALFDTFGQTRAVESVRAASNADRLAAYSWNLGPELVKDTLRRGADGYLAKNLPGERLVDGLERIALGEIVVSDEALSPGRDLGDWPGHDRGLTVRESEIIALITQGLSNQDIAARAFLSINTIKSYIRTSYRKMNVTSRSQAVLWGVAHGFRPDYVRLEAPLDEASTS